LKLGWDMMHSDSRWAILLKSRVKRGNKFIGYDIFSSLWSGIKSQAHYIMENTTWILGDGKDINLWLDDWSGVPLADLCNIPTHLRHQLKNTVSEYLHDNQWQIPVEIQLTNSNLSQHIEQVTIPIIHFRNTLSSEAL